MENIEATLMQDERFHIEKYWRLVKPRLHIVIIITLVMVAAAYVKVSMKKPVYAASGLLMIEPEPRSIIMFDTNTAFSGYRNEYFNTQIRILQSQTIIQRVNESFQTSSIGRTAAKEDEKLMIQGPIISPLEFTRLVEVSYRSTNPKAASEMVNTLFRQFEAFNLELKTESTERASGYIQDQIKNLQTALQQKEEEMQAYGKKKELFFVSKEDSAVVEKFADLNKAYTNAQIDRLNREAVYDELKRTSYDNYPEVKQNQLISNLKNTYSSLESEYRRKSQIFKSSYPEMEQLKSQMDSLQQRIQEEIRDIAQKNLREAASEYESAKKKEESMLELLEKQKGVMVDSNSDAIYYNTLAIEVENNRSLLNYLVKKHKESQVSSRLEGIQTLNIKVIDWAQEPKSPIDSGSKRTLMMAFMLGLFLGFGFIFVIDYLDRTIKDPEEAKAILGIPTLGIIPSTSSKIVNAYYKSSYKYGGNTYAAAVKNKPMKDDKNPQPLRDIELINHKEPDSPFAESYRTIRTSILLSIPKQAPKVLSITSAQPSEGKTATTINLAISFSQLGKKVVIVDGDMRKPRMHKIFKLKNTVGLSSYLVGRVKLTEILQKIDIPNVFVIPSGPLPPNPTELIDSDIMADTIQKLKERVDFIFIDTPPLVGIVDPILLGKHADGMLLVTWAGKTHRSIVLRAKEELDKFNIRTLGLILNKAAEKRRGYYGYDYSYQGYNYRYKEEKPGAENKPPHPAKN